jgi:type II protein arginine methyltransferase
MTAPATLDTLLSHVAEKPVPMVRLAHLLLAKGEVKRALELCARAIAMAPDSGEVHALAAEAFSNKVPTWYFPLLRDTARHRIYEKAFRRVIRPGSRVLDIGAGTGLFAMMAARAGAAEVVTCEANLAVAKVVSEIVARNGLADRVRVIAKHSSDLEIGPDLMGPADVVVWDNLSRNLIGAGALPTVEQAVRRLVRPNAAVIPARGTIRVALAEDREAYREQMGIVEGFDLSPFNRLAVPCYYISHDKERAVRRSEPYDLFRFDFQSGGPFPESRATVTLSTPLGGRVNGIAQWIYLELDEEGWHEAPPSAKGASVLGAMFYPLMQPIEMAPGDNLTICGAHDRQSLLGRSPRGVMNLPLISLLRKLWQLPWYDRLLLLKAILWLAVARLVIVVLPFRYVGRLAALRARRPEPVQELRMIEAQRVRWALISCARRVPWRAMCFEQGLAAQFMLRRRGAPSVLYYGAALDDHEGLAAHVWVRDGDIDVIGCEIASRFAVLAAFPSQGGPRLNSNRSHHNKTIESATVTTSILGQRRTPR